MKTFCCEFDANFISHFRMIGKTLLLIAFAGVLSLAQSRRNASDVKDYVAKYGGKCDRTKSQSCPPQKLFFCCSDVVKCDGPPTVALHNEGNYPMCGINIDACSPPNIDVSWTNQFNTAVDIVAFCAADCPGKALQNLIITLMHNLFLQIAYIDVSYRVQSSVDNVLPFNFQRHGPESLFLAL